MKYRQFLFDLDDTLLDFKASERLSFERTLAALGLAAETAAIFPHYQRENAALWAEFEQGRVAKDWLKVERFRRAFAHHGVDSDPARASTHYLDCLPQTVVLIDGAAQLCERLAAIGEIGIITNGIEAVQTTRIANSGLAPFLSFVATSETCGHAKPDARFFDYAAARFRRFAKPEAIIVGDRLDADIAGAHGFGIDSCWFNPADAALNGGPAPTYQAARLDEIEAILAVTA
ncbi:YjjG family noncanonical pyrimidine nucleotidase [Sphingomonas sp. G-3-2-10]|uniref:YjjG family noncanonical pyrimidine nucleotidase n=1 Tax=Sphingomonas sp. G-3-2-10 TaxID=2728838 RepID=UPI00146C57FB|nr:YjjG family noncanonical pyrimidine nucleotidase [Sphingomonas sp. G-3-2-10]NML08257.1 noncanonical pyrimidine nucleotidase, YjjG family [Sphingomonas sp. G-3-2-10]